MSVTLYDKALTEKIKGWVTDVNTTILSPEETTEMFRIVADKTNDRPISLPLITIKRERDSTIDITAYRSMSSQGKVFNNKKGISDHLNAVPISLTYNINIYARTMEQVDEYVRNFVFYFINYPRIRINIPYNDSQLFQDCFIRLNDTITDNSDIPERLISGQFSRFTLSVSIPDAYLFSYNHRKVPKVTSITVDMDTDKIDGDTIRDGSDYIEAVPNTQESSGLADKETIELIKE